MGFFSRLFSTEEAHTTVPCGNCGTRPVPILYYPDTYCIGLLHAAKHAKCEDCRVIQKANDEKKRQQVANKAEEAREYLKNMRRER